MDSGKFIDTVLDILGSKHSVRERYKEFKKKLKERKALWDEDKIRIGLLGVTSSGKSTLINAVIGMELLSSAVKPTSGQLVSCYKGKEPCAKISFESARDLILKDSELRLENIRKYSDENENKGNRENVTGIDICTPSFDFGDNVVLIDSAGLDAYKLESHEKLSLEIMLPTIDMCVFITSLKTSSDEKTRDFLNSVAKWGCPLLIVQNMLDSVEPSADGKKSREQVAQDHKNRLIRIIEKSNIKDKNSVGIVQVSALYAMKEKCQGEKVKEDSHYSEFKDLIEQMIDKEKPAIDQVRCGAIANECYRLIEEEEKYLSGKSTEKPKFRYEGLIEQIQRYIDVIDDKLEEALLGLKNESHKHSNQSVNAVRAKVSKYENDILSIITKTNSYISDDISKRLNTPLRDLIEHVQFLDKIPEPKEIIKKETKQRKVEKEGFFSGTLARGFGKLFKKDDWGYEYESYTVESIDHARTDEEIKRYIERTFAAHNRTVQGWRKNLDKTIDRINSIIDDEYGIFKERQKDIESAADVKYVLDSLKTLIKNTNRPEKPEASNTVIKKSAPDEANISKTELSRYQLGLFDLSKNLIHSISKTALVKCMEEINAPDNKIILGWDIESMRDFVIRFTGISFDSHELEKKGDITAREIICVFQPDAARLKKIKSGNYPASFFIMVNAQQDGKAKKDISALTLKNSLKSGDRVFFVVQDFDSLINSGGISEMKANLREYYREFEIMDNKGFILINDANPVYNLAFVHDQLDPCDSISKEQELLTRLKKTLPFLWDAKTAKNTADLIRNKGGM